MKIKKGTTRTTFIFDYVVVKIPAINFIIVFKEIYYSLKLAMPVIRKQGFKKYYLKKKAIKRRATEKEKAHIQKESEELGLELIPCKSYEIFSIKYLMFSGIMANWNEYLFYRETKNLFVLPTYLSIFGLINFQKRGKEIYFWNSDEIREYICINSVDEDQIFCDSHTFAKKENFCLDGDKLKMLDYGSRHVHNFLRLNGDKLFNNFIKPPV
ncbi:MAG: hypothetical protein WCK59_04220 [Candidatus Falkowbacteria bacterium]